MNFHQKEECNNMVKRTIQQAIRQIKKSKCYLIAKSLCSLVNYAINKGQIATLLQVIDEFEYVPQGSRLQCAVRFNDRQTEYFTGCRLNLPLTGNCRNCPFWSESLWDEKHRTHQ